MKFGLQHVVAAGKAVVNVVPFQVNKYIRMGLSAFVVLLGFLISVNWTEFLTPEKAGAVVMILGGIKFLYNCFAPGWGVSTIGTNTNIVTQRAEGPGNPQI